MRSEVWAYTAWNLAFNVSVMMPTPEDRWRWVSAGLRLLRDDGLSFNPSNPELYRELAWLFLFKMGGGLDKAANFYQDEWKKLIEAAQTSGDWTPLKMVPEKMSAVDEAALTGESIPVDKSAGDPVSAATINQSGYLKCEATRVGEDTTLSQIIKMVSDAAATKAPIAKIADRVSGVFVPVVIGIAIVTTVIWLLCGREIGYALARGISVLVISCPCALGLATPVAIMVGNGVGARNGILFKTAVSLEEAGKTDIVVLDKTGTITAGEPKVTDVIPAAGTEADELIALAAAVEQHSEHPLAKAVMLEAANRRIRFDEISDFEALTGSGVRGKLGNAVLTGGSLEYIKTQ